MKKTDWKYLVDTLLFIFLVGIALIGFLMGLVLPKGPDASESAKYFLCLHRHQWGNVHFYLSIAFFALVIVHLILGWSWVKGKARKLFQRGWATMLILTALASLLVLFLFWAFYPKVPAAHEKYGKMAGRQAKAKAFKEDSSSILITGQVTFHDIERMTGIPARKIADELNLPADAPLDERLGQVRKKYSFTMQEVKDVIARLIEDNNGR